MIVVFFCNPMDRKKVDMEYEFEYKIAEKLGFKIELIDYETLVANDDPKESVKFVNTYSKVKQGIFRGWMLRPAFYEKLYSALIDKNIKLVNDPDEYRNCHYMKKMAHGIW